MASGIDPRGMKPAQARGVLHYQVFEELVIYHPDAGQAAGLNESAAAIWQLCDGERTLEEICANLAQSLHVPSDDLREDVRKAVAQLFELGLLRENAAKPARDR